MVATGKFVCSACRWWHYHPTEGAEPGSEQAVGYCRRFPPAVQNPGSAHIERLIESHAWTDAALALIDLELPQWQVRRLAYDDGEWYCALSRQRELPDWLDQSIETRHADLALAILSAFVEAQRVSTSAPRTGVPTVPQAATAWYEPMYSDNFA